MVKWMCDYVVDYGGDFGCIVFVGYFVGVYSVVMLVFDI